MKEEINFPFLRKIRSLKKILLKAVIKKTHNITWLRFVVIKLVKLENLYYFEPSPSNQPFSFVMSKSKETSFYSIPKYDFLFEPTAQKKISKPIQITVYKNVTIWGNSNLALINDKWIIDYELYKCKVFKLNDRRSFLETNDGVYIQIRNDESINTIESGVFLISNFSSNYFHLLFELIPKLIFAESSKIPIHVPLLIDENVFNVTQFRELITRFKSKQRKILKLKFNNQYQIKELYHISNINQIPSDYKSLSSIRPNDNLFNFKYLQSIREKILLTNNFKQIDRKIFISRKHGVGRSYNEDDVWDFLHTKGFIKVYPEKLTIYEQAELFNSASFIVGASGAAFSNIIYCRKGTNIICLVAYKSHFSVFATLASFSETNLIYLSDNNKEVTKKSYLHDSFNINIKELDNLLARSE